MACIHESMLTLQLVGFCGIYLRAVSQQGPMLLFCIMSFKILILTLPPHFWGDKELRCMLSTFWKSIFKQQLRSRFDIMDSKSSFFLYFDICNYICLDTSYNFLALSLLLKYSLFFKYSCTNILHRRSPRTFYVSCKECGFILGHQSHQLTLNSLLPGDTIWLPFLVLTLINKYPHCRRQYRKSWVGNGLIPVAWW